MVHGMEGADDAAHGLSQGAVEVGIGIVVQQVVGQQRLHGDVGILGVAAAVLVGIAGSHLGALVEMGGLNGKAVAGLIFVLPVFTHSVNHAAEFVAHNGGILGAVVGNALVVRALHGSLIGAHADTVGHDFDLHVIGANLRQVDLLQTQIHLAMDSNSFRFHGISHPF